MEIPAGSLIDEGLQLWKFFLLVSNMQLPLFCPLLGLINSFTQLLDFKLYLYTAQQYEAQLNPLSYTSFDFSRGITRMSPPCRFWHDRSSPELQRRTTDWFMPESATHWNFPAGWAGWSHLPSLTRLLQNSLLYTNFSSSSHRARHSPCGARHSPRVPIKHRAGLTLLRTRGSAWSWHLSLTCNLFAMVRVWLTTVNCGFACCLKQLMGEWDKKANITARREESFGRTECPTPGLWKRQDWDPSHPRALGQGVSSASCLFYSNTTYLPCESTQAQIAGFHTALHLLVIK